MPRVAAPAPFCVLQDEEVGDKAVPLADRSILGTTINILCSAVPVFWA